MDASDLTECLQGTRTESPAHNPINNIEGFPTGTYFEIRARGSNNVLLTYDFSNEDGAQIQLWPRPSGGDELRAAVSTV